MQLYKVILIVNISNHQFTYEIYLYANSFSSPSSNDNFIAPLHLLQLQWNSALAVSYPARKFGIVRGDSFEKIREKSKGECVCIHLPVTALNDTASPLRKHTQKTNSVREDESKTNEEDNSAPFGEDDVKASYNSEFNQSAQVRDEMYAREKNRMRSKNEGKACLDRLEFIDSACDFLDCD